MPTLLPDPVTRSRSSYDWLPIALILFWIAFAVVMTVGILKRMATN